MARSLSQRPESWAASAADDLVSLAIEIDERVGEVAALEVRSKVPMPTYKRRQILKHRRVSRPHRRPRSHWRAVSP
jgi:hypothetical protein